MLKTNSNKNDKNRKNTKPIYGSPAIGMLGLGIITIFGIPSLLGVFAPNDKTQDKQAINGYGASSYGP